MVKLENVRINNKVSLAYQTINLSKKNNPILIFLHEGLGSIAQWKSFPKELCEKLNLPDLIYDRYGYGHSTELLKERDANYLHTKAKYYLPKLLEKLSLQNRKLILIGHSDGASIALIFASLFPATIMAVVSMAAHVFVEQISINSILKMEAEYKRNDNLKRRLEKYHFHHTDSTFYAFSKTITSKAFKDWNIENYLPKIKAPILVIQGSDDEYGTEKQVDSISTKAPHPDNKKLLIPNCGHLPNLSNQQTVIQEIENFIPVL